MQTESLNWKEFFTEGQNYFKKSSRWAANGKFSNDLIYNLVLMSIEKHFMALLVKNGLLPDNHTISDLIEAVRKVKPLDKELEKKLLDIETYQMICSFADYGRRTEEISDITRVVSVGEEVKNMVEGELLFCSENQENTF